MSRHLSMCLKLVGVTMVIICGVYPLFLWIVGQVVFPNKANGSLVLGPDG